MKHQYDYGEGLFVLMLNGKTDSSSNCESNVDV